MLRLGMTGLGFLTVSTILHKMEQMEISGSATVIRTESGLVEGTGGTMRSFKGIPYAAPPVGDLRWRPPQPVKPWPGVRAATAFAADPPQAVTSRTRAASMNEDCLTLNIWAPEKGRRAAPGDGVALWRQLRFGQRFRPTLRR